MRKERPTQTGDVIQVVPFKTAYAIQAFLDSPVCGPLPMVGILEINETTTPPEMTVNGIHVDGNLAGAKHGDRVILYTTR